MLVLDTNVVSELMRARPEAVVLAWVAGQQLSALNIAAISVTEIGFGLRLLPDGRRRADLDMRFSALVAQGFADRVLPFDRQAAEVCAEIRAQRQRAGRPVSVEDAMIAAIAAVHSATVATRDESGFQGCGVSVVNPWAAVG